MEDDDMVECCLCRRWVHFECGEVMWDSRRLKYISKELDTTDLQSNSHVVVHAGTNDLTERDDEHDIANIGKEAERLCTIVRDKNPRVKLVAIRYLPQGR
ncbi:Hypp8241 [Branchiostoma lanceolatum]|uniref:Hypp8241 protein n=1 Tax=Branchiostoma lanceolatum TaxID=7740 RepID=A0A8J9Z7I4_BRALA|nr:Hypp8241 [Branchiostoma lanceolatum]